MAILNFYPTDERAQAAFQFDHAQAHLSLIETMNDTTSSPILDPMIRTSLGAPDIWSLDHQGAHDDAAAFFGVEPSLPIPDETTGDPWWVFVNDQEHQALATAALRGGS